MCGGGGFRAAAQAEYTSSEKSAKGLECSVKNFNFILKSMGTQRKIFQIF